MLAGFDARVASTGFPLVRYSDDIVVLAASRDEAQEGLRVMTEAAGELGMPLGAGKSAVMSFEEGFCFLGEDFGPRYPPALADQRVIEPDRKVLYLGMQGAHAHMEAGRLIVQSAQDAEVLDIPSGTVERIVCFGAVGISAGLRSWALTSEVELVFLSRRGTYLGQAWTAAGGRRISRLRAQMSVADDPARAAAVRPGRGGREGPEADGAAAAARAPRQHRDRRVGRRPDRRAAGHAARVRHSR